MFTQDHVEDYIDDFDKANKRAVPKVCDGCAAGCSLGANYTTQRCCIDGVLRPVFVPMINDRIIYNYIDEAGCRLQPYIVAGGAKGATQTIEDAYALTNDIAQLCDNHYKVRPTLYPPLIQREEPKGFTQKRSIAKKIGELPNVVCEGCHDKCTLSAAYGDSVIYPVIGKQIIKSYIDAQGRRQTILSTVCKSFIEAQDKAKREICLQCSHYQQNTK